MVLGCARHEDREWRRLWESHSTYAALMLIELIHLHRLPIDEVLTRIAVEGEDHLRASLSSGRGAMLFINHLGNMACTVGGLAIRGYDITLAGNRIRVPFLERKIVEIHERVGARRVHLGQNLAWQAARVFRRNGIFATFFDFSVSRKHDVWLQFGSAEMSVSLAPAILAMRNGVDVLYARCVRLPANRHQITISPLVPQTCRDVHADAGALMQEAIRLLYEDLSCRPAEWWPWDKAHLRLRSRSGYLGEPVATPPELVQL